MKTINPKFSRIYVLLFCLISIQTIFATIIIRKDDPAPGGGGGIEGIMTTSTFLKTTALKSRATVIPVTADIIDGELGIYFSNSVGIAYVSIVDQNGTIVDTEILDTTTNLELYIPIDGLTSGSYKLKISYGSTNLVGDFQL
jgi:hypothetical protein